MSTEPQPQDDKAEDDTREIGKLRAAQLMADAEDETWLGI